MNKVSVLLPTRGRYDIAVRSMNSLIDNSNSKEAFEILLAVDNDDKDTTDLLANYISDKPYVKMFFFERQYYRGLHNYYNALALKSEGSSLMLWNDDAVMESKNWDSEIINNHKEFCVLSPKVSNMESFWRNVGVLFPVLPKKWIEITGEWAQVPACDSVIDILSKRLNIQVHLETVVITHDRFELTGNNHDNTYVEVRSDKDNHSFHHIFHIGKPEVIEDHYQKLVNYIQNKQEA